MAEGVNTSGALLVVDESERFQIAQAVYSAATGKTEKLSKAFTKSYVVRRPDLQQLHAKCSQACTQWNVLQKSCSVVVHHIDENAEQFSSFERFNIYDSSKTAPIESIVFEFNVLIGLKNAEKPQHYKTTIRILSKIALYKKMEEDSPPMSILRVFGNAAIVVEIEYVDYVIARNLLGMIESWVNEVEITNDWRWAEKIQSYTHWFSPAFQLVIIPIALMALVAATGRVLTPTSTPPDMVSWLLYVFALLWISVIVAKILGKFVESAIDHIADISAVIINKGDERLVEHFKRKNRRKTGEAIAGTCILIAQAIGTKALTPLLSDLFHK